jgi:hypothetical protein
VISHTNATQILGRSLKKDDLLFDDDESKITKENEGGFSYVAKLIQLNLTYS